MQKFLLLFFRAAPPLAPPPPVVPPNPEGLDKLRDSVRNNALNQAERTLEEKALAQEIAFKTLSPDYRIYKLRPDVVQKDLGVLTSIYERSMLENNIQLGGKKSHDTFLIANEGYTDLVIPKDTCNVVLEVSCPTFVFNRSEVMTGLNGVLVFPNPDRRQLLHSFMWSTLPTVVCHRSMWPIRCLWKRELNWWGGVLFDSTETGISEICWNVQNGMMGDSYEKEWWQQRLPSALYACKENEYSQSWVYALSPDELPGWNSNQSPNDMRVCGLKIHIPYYVLQSPDLTYASRYAQNRIQTVVKCSLGYLVGAYAFISHNTEEVPFAEHDFVSNHDTDVCYHIPKANEMRNSKLPGWCDKYLSLYLDTNQFHFYAHWNPERGQVSRLCGPTVIGMGDDSYIRRPGIAIDNGEKTADERKRLVNEQYLFKLENNLTPNHTKFHRNGKLPLNDYLFNFMQTLPFRNWTDTVNGYVPACPKQERVIAPWSIVDCWFMTPTPIDWYQSSEKTILIPDVISYGNGIYVKRPYQTAIVGDTSPAALPYRFSGLDGNRNCSQHRLTFHFDDNSDEMSNLILLTNDSGSLLPMVNLASKCFIERKLVNLDPTALAQMNMDRDVDPGLTTQMWNSNDTQEGIFKLSAKEKYTQIVLNDSNNTLTYGFYFIHLSHYTKGNCKREHPLSFTDFDCKPFNQIFSEITIKWKSNNSPGEQLTWNFYSDPEMDIFYEFFVNYQKHFWPESKIPTQAEWLIKPVIIFSPNTHGGCPMRKFTSYNTGKITLDATYRNGLTVNDFFSIFGENYNFNFDPTLRTPAIGYYMVGHNQYQDFLYPPRWRQGLSQDGTDTSRHVSAGTKRTPAAADFWLNPADVTREIRGDLIPMDFSELNQLMSELAFRIVMTDTQLLSFSGSVKNGAVPCTIFIRSGGTGPIPSIVTKKM